MSTAVVIYISPKVASGYTLLCLEPLAGRPMIRHLISRLQEGLSPALPAEFHVVCHNENVASRLREVLAELPVSIFCAGAPSRLMALSEFGRSHPTLTTFLLFSEYAIFPDCLLTAQMIRAHRYDRAEGTIGGEIPRGLLPDIFESQAIQRLAGLGVADEPEMDLFLLMQKCSAFAGDDAEMSFRIQAFKADPAAGKARSQWPSRLLADELRSLRACEAVLRKNIAGYGDAQAVAFKKELLGQTPEAVIDIPISPEEGKIPILFTTSFNAFSGAEECFYDLIAHLDRRRFVPLAVLPSRGVLFEKLTAAGVPTTVLPMRFEELTLFSVRSFERLLERLRIKLVHINGDAGPALVVAAYRRGLPIVTHARTLMGSKVPELFQFSRKIIAVSKAAREDLLCSDLRPDDVVTIYDGQGFDAFNPENYERAAVRAQAGIPANKQVIGFIARICPQKRPTLLIDALPKVIERFPNALALIVGETYPSDAAYGEQLRAQVERLHLQNYVRFWGFEKEIATIHALSDVLALCGHREAFSHCVLEALAMGVPTVTPDDGGGHTEIIKDGENGILYDPSDPKHLSKALIRLLSDPSLAKKIGGNGRQTIQSYDIATHVQAVTHLYHTLL